MKKVIFLLSLCLCVGFSAMAQDDDDDGLDAAYFNKRGVYLLPQAGDFALGIDASPFLRYLGNFFSSNDNRAPNFNGVNQMIYGKYFLEDDRALRVRLGLNLYNNAQMGVVENDEAVASDPLNRYARVNDIFKESSSEVQLGIGYEFRRGSGRVQGFYGGEILLGYGFGKDKYEYANPMTALNQRPSSYDFNGNIWGPMRVTEKNYGHGFSAGLGGFAGVEYFFAPQMSIGGELILGVIVNRQGQSETTTERWNTSLDSVETQTRRDIGNQWTVQNIMAGNIGGRVFLMFHF